MLTRLLHRDASGVAIATITSYRPRRSREVHAEVLGLGASRPMPGRPLQAAAVLDGAGYLVSASPGLLRLCGYEADEAAGLHLRTLFPRLGPLPISFEREGESWAGETEMSRKDGSTAPVSLRLTRARDARGAPIGLVARLTSAALQGQRADRVVETRASRARLLEHNLRNVFTSIIGNVQMVDTAVDDRILQRRLALIEDAARSGADLLDQA